MLSFCVIRHPVYPFTRNLLQWSVPNLEVGNGGPGARNRAFRQVCVK